MSRLATALYRAALFILPRDFRDRYGPELVDCFAEVAVSARLHGRFAVGMVLLRSIVDTFFQAVLLRTKRNGNSPALRGDHMWQDLRYAARRLLRRPSFTFVTVLTLALGVAAATSVFTLVNGVVLSPLPYPRSDRIVQVDHGAHGIGIDKGLGVTVGFFRFYRENLRSVESMGLYFYGNATFTGSGEPVQLTTAGVTASLSDVLQVRPLLGRWFSVTEGTPGTAPVVVISEQLWRERLGADPAVVGRAIQLGGAPVTVIGVMPASFAFPTTEVRLWTPFVVPLTHIGGWGEKAIARLKDGVTTEALQREIASLYPRLREDPADPARVASYLDDAGVYPRIVPLKDEMIGDVRVTLWVLLGTVGFVLLIAVANVANLFLVRAEEGQREAAVRTALGAARGRLFKSALAETLLLASTAGALGFGIAVAAVRLLKLYAPVNIPRQHEIGLRPEVLAVALGVTLVIALLLGLIPVLGRRIDLGTMLKEGARRSTSSRTRLQGRNVLVAAQVALALVLLIGSGLLLRTYAAMRAVPLGFSERNALVFELGLATNRYPTRADAKAFQDRLHERLTAIPGVVSAGAIGQCLPLTGYMCSGEIIEVEGRPAPQGTLPPVTGNRTVTRDYFRSIGILVRGRTFTAADEMDRPKVVILSEATAQAYFPGEDPIGRRIRFDGKSDPEGWLTVIGVANNVRVRIESDDFKRIMYLPITPLAKDGPHPSLMSWVVAARVPSATLVPEVRRIMDELDPGLALAKLGTLEGLISSASAPTAFSLALVALAAGIALLLGAVGVYAVIAYAVSRRTAEIGVRLALGARAADVRWMVLRQGGAVVLAGIGVGLVGAVLLTRTLRAMLFGVSPTDVPSYAALTAVMLLVALAALYLPARRASRVDPMEALRAD
jgi:predicted permease